MWAACYAIFISFCVQNKQQKTRKKTKVLEGFSYPIFLNLHSFFFRLFYGADKTRKTMKFLLQEIESWAELWKIFHELSCVSYLPPKWKKQKKDKRWKNILEPVWFINKRRRKKWWEIFRRKMFRSFFPLDKFPPELIMCISQNFAKLIAYISGSSAVDG